jgi:hypothetical protein
MPTRSEGILELPPAPALARQPPKRSLTSARSVPKALRWLWKRERKFWTLSKVHDFTVLL